MESGSRMWRDSQRIWIQECDRTAQKKEKSIEETEKQTRLKLEI